MPRIDCLVALMIAGTLGIAACSTGTLVTPPMIDAGDEPDMMIVDAAPEGGVSLSKCAVARTTCDGRNVRKCEGSTPGQVVEICQETCSLGRCTTSTCSAREAADVARGCLFYGAQPDNIDSDDDKQVMVILSNAGLVPVNARLDVRQVDGDWTTVTTAVIPASKGTRIEIARPNLDAGPTKAGAFRVETDGPVLATQIVSDDQTHAARSSAGTVLRPLQGLGNNHLAVTAPAQESPEVARTPGSRGGAGAITIIGTVADTNVHVQLTAPAMVSPGGRLDPPSVHDAVLGEGDVLQIFSATPAADLTGTRITSDFPVAVFTGNIFTTYGYALNTSNGGDMAQEQLPPIGSWSTEYVGARLSPQVGCDSFFGVGAGYWRIVASEATAVTLNPARGVLIDAQNLPSGMTFTLAEGGSQSFFTRSELGSSTSPDFFVHADKPFLLAQWLDCEPGLSFGMDTRFGGGDLGFTLPPGFDHEVIVVRKAGTNVTFDDVALSDQLFVPVSDGAGYEAARLGSALLGSCADAYDACDHHLAGPQFGVSWRGIDVVCSYSLTVPSWGEVCALPSVPCTE